MIDFFLKYPNKITEPLLEHLQLTIITLFFSIGFAILLTILCVKWKFFKDLLLQIFSVIYAIPSLALFALLIPFTGLGKVTAIIILSTYNQYLLLRNFLTGIDEVRPEILEAAKGMGLSDMQILWKIQVPLSKRAVFAGIRLAAVSTIGIATIAATINAGGLGSLLFDGLRTMNTSKILWGSLLSALVSILIDFILKKVEKRYEVHG